MLSIAPATAKTSSAAMGVAEGRSAVGGGETTCTVSANVFRKSTISSAGRFPATDNAKEDCRFCDFGEVCGVRADKWNNVSCRYADWTARNVGELDELELFRHVRTWDE